MTPAEERACALGRVYLPGDTDLPEDTPDDIRAFVKTFERSLDNDGVHMTCAVLNSMAWDDPVLRQFACRGPMDAILISLQVDIEPLLTSRIVYATFHRVLDVGTNVDHFVCGLSPLVVSAVADTECFEEMLGVATRALTVCEVARDCFCDVTLFRALAWRGVRSSQPLRTFARVCIFLTRGCYFTEPRYVDDTLRHSVLALVRTRASNGDDALDSVIDSLTTWFARAPSLCDWFAEVLVDLWRTGWPAFLGPLMAHALITTSVRFVVVMEILGKLAPFVRCVHDHATSDCHWRIVRAALRRAWPAKVHDEEVVSVIEEEGDAQDAFLCPITMERMRHPCVASDGHTYERDAILQHLVRNGFVSPITRQPLTDHLVDNRALM